MLTTEPFLSTTLAVGVGFQDADIAKAAIVTGCRYNRINPKTLQYIPPGAGSEAARIGSMRGIGQRCGSSLIGVLDSESVLPT